jgi:hypothetical protein
VDLNLKDGEDGVVGMERLSHAPSLWIGVVGVGIVGDCGVMGFEFNGPVRVRVVEMLILVFVRE